MTFFAKLERLRDRLAEIPERTLSGPERERIDAFLDANTWRLSDADTIAAIINRAEEVVQNRIAL